MEYGEEERGEEKSELIFEGYYVFVSLSFLICWILSMEKSRFSRKRELKNWNFKVKSLFFSKG